MRRLLLGLLVLLAACSDGDPAPEAAPRTTTTTAARAEVAGWEHLPDPPLSPRTGATAVWTGREVVVVGGWEFLCPPNADCSTPEEPPFGDGAAYDPERGTWRRIAEAPTGFTHAAPAAVDGDAFFLVPGTGLLRYRPDDDRWDQLPAPPGLLDRRLVASGGDLIAFLVADEQDERPDWRLDLDEERWSRLADDPLPPSYDRQLVEAGEDLLLFAKPLGVQSGALRGARLRAGDGQWELLPDAPPTGFQAWAVDDRVVINPHFGAEGGGIVDPGTGSWRPLPTPPAERWSGDLAGALGRRGATYESTSGWVLDLPGDAWVEVPPVAGAAMEEAAVTAAGRRLFTFGGARWADADGELVGEAWVWTPPA